MNENPTLSTFSMEKTDKPVNQDLSIIFHPASVVSKYEYVVTKDGKEGTMITVSSNRDVPIYLLEKFNFDLGGVIEDIF